MQSKLNATRESVQSSTVFGTFLPVLCLATLSGCVPLQIRCLLIEPFPESALNEEAGKLLMEDYEAYAKHARLMTSVHAAHGKRCASRSCLLLCRGSAMMQYNTVLRPRA